MSRKYRRLNGQTPMQVYTKIAFIGILVCIAYAVLSKGEFIRHLTWGRGKPRAFTRTCLNLSAMQQTTTRMIGRQSIRR